MVYSLMVPSLLKVGLHILLLLFLLSFHVDSGMITNNYFGRRCNVTANYTAGGAFEANMRSVFSTLTKDASSVLFANATAGQGSEKVYGLFQCRGDADQDDCNECISKSTVEVVDTYCPNAMDAIIWYEQCQLRYSNTNFFGLLNVEDSASWCYPYDKVERTEAFVQTLDSLLNKLTYQATTEPSSRFLFATDDIPFDVVVYTIYGLVQCTRDTSLAGCNQCLNSTIYQIPARCEEDRTLSRGCEIATGSCRVRFGTRPFYITRETPSPSPSTDSSDTASDKVNHSRVIAVTTITVITFALTSTYLF